MCLSLIVLGVLAAIPSVEWVGILVIVFAVIFVVSFAYSWGPVVWVVCSELFPVRARGKAAGITTATNWIFTTIIGAVFPTAQKASLSGCFFFFSAIIGTASLIVFLYLPETANLNILQIDTIVNSHKPSLKRPGLCSCSPEGKIEADALPLADASQVPSAVFDRKSGRYEYDKQFAELSSSVHSQLDRLEASSTKYATFSK